MARPHTFRPPRFRDQVDRRRDFPGRRRLPADCPCSGYCQNERCDADQFDQSDRPAGAEAEYCAGSESGQTVALVALIVAVVAGATVLVGMYGGLVVDRTRAKDAADAAALAGAVDGEPGARSLAEANRGTLEHFRQIDERTVEVTVRVGRARATSRAEPITVAVRAGVP